MNRRPSAPQAVVRRPFPAVVAAVVLALCLAAYPLAAAHADSCEGQVICLNPITKPTREPTPTQAPTSAAPTPVQPAPAPTQAPTAAPAPSTSEAAEGEPSPEETATATPSATATSIPFSSAAPHTAAAAPTDSNWNKPAEESAKVKQAAAVMEKEGPDTAGLTSIMGGVLLVAVGGMALALWNRNRLQSSH